jgi:hypothetical protein
MQALVAIDLVELITVTGGGSKKFTFKGKGGGNVIPGIGTINAEGEYTTESTTDDKTDLMQEYRACATDPKVDSDPAVRRATCLDALQAITGAKPRQ